MRAAALTLPLAVALWAAPAAAEPVFTGKVSLTGLYYTEDDGQSDPNAVSNRSATTANLGFVELRGLVEGKRLWGDRLDLRLDLRLRFTGSLDFERKFNPKEDSETALTSLGLTARGYVGGSEYELRQAYALLRITDRDTLQAGRMFVTEADSAKIDGLRYLRGFASGRVEGSAYVGAYPNPFSRSVLTDYSAPCGAGVSSATVQSGTINLSNGTGPCQDGAALALAGATLDVTRTEPLPAGREAPLGWAWSETDATMVRDRRWRRRSIGGQHPRECR